MTGALDELLPGAQLLLRGMGLSLVAQAAPDRPAVLSPHGDRTFAELNARANQMARALRSRGLRPGDGVALLCPNRPEFVEVLAGCVRSGLRFTPVNWHLGAEEVAYILGDCGARAFVADERFAAVAAAAGGPSVRIGIGDGAGFEPYEAALAAEPDHDVEDPELGGVMMYTSGTTGYPKGVSRRITPESAMARLAQQAAWFASAGYRPEADLSLVTGPLYHSAPLGISLTIPHVIGVGAVLMDGWDPEGMLRAIERHRVTHTHMVPTMFHRLLALPPDVRARYDLSSLRYVIHGAAPCPVHVKRALIEWLDPIVWEYYAATEAPTGTMISSEEWLARPGSVGRPIGGQAIEIRGGDGRALPPGEPGVIWFRAPEAGRFEYHEAPEKTASTYEGDWFTLGDEGYVDPDGYLFLTDRTADLIISGGVNVYPAEVDAVLLEHPAVADAAVIGVPNEEWGEEVKAVVELRPGVAGSDALAAELIAHCRARLAHFKCPRSVDFADRLPRTDVGKVFKRLLRERYRRVDSA